MNLMSEKINSLQNTVLYFCLFTQFLQPGGCGSDNVAAVRNGNAAISGLCAMAIAHL